MSKDNNNKVNRSRLIPKAYKKKYCSDYEELKQELKTSKKELKSCIKKIPKTQMVKIKAFLSIA